jgi:penicillin-insensitive murein endopeptidase
MKRDPPRETLTALHGRRLLDIVLPAVAGVLLVSLEGASQPQTGAVSMGHANDGALLRGVRLPDEGPGYVSIPSRPELDYKFGTEELVEAVMAIARDLERWAPGATLVVGDLSVQGGGPTSRHESHQAGRDVDLLFYALDEAGGVARPRAVGYDGTARAVRGDGAGRVFDTRRNWLVLRSLIENGDAHLQRVIVSEPLRALLLEPAASVREPRWIVERAGEVMCDSWSSHDDHFHVRLFCTAEDYRAGCRDEFPLYPWRRTELAAQKIFSPVLEEDPYRRSPRAKRWMETSRVDRTWCP